MSDPLYKSVSKEKKNLSFCPKFLCRISQSHKGMHDVVTFYLTIFFLQER